MIHNCKVKTRVIFLSSEPVACGIQRDMENFLWESAIFGMRCKIDVFSPYFCNVQVSSLPALLLAHPIYMTNFLAN